MRESVSRVLKTLTTIASLVFGFVLGFWALPIWYLS
jgi:hypothetical protein